MPLHRREAGLVDRTKMAGIRAMLKLGSSLTGALGDGPPITTCSPSSMRRRMSRSPARPTVIGMGWSGRFRRRVSCCDIIWRRNCCSDQRIPAPLCSFAPTAAATFQKGDRYEPGF